MKQSKEVRIKSNNAQVTVTNYDVNVEGKSIEELLIKALRDKSEAYSNTFRAKVSIVIEELEDDLVIIGVPEDEEKEEVSEEDGKSEEL